MSKIGDGLCRGYIKIGTIVLCVDALEIYIAEKLGFQVVPGQFFKDHDDGMDVLGAALYVAMKEEDFGSGD